MKADGPIEHRRQETAVALDRDSADNGWCAVAVDTFEVAVYIEDTVDLPGRRPSAKDVPQ
jgi:hypothetical protein